MIQHGFHLDEGVAIGSADFLDCLLNGIFNLIFDYLMTILRAKNDVIVDIVDAVVCFSFHTTIIALERVFVNALVALIGRLPLSSHGASLWVFRGIGLSLQRELILSSKTLFKSL